MPRAERNRRLFASAIAGSTLSGSTTSRRTRAGTNPTTPFVIGEEVGEEEGSSTIRTDTSN